MGKYTEFFIPFRLPGMNEIIDANRTNKYAGAELKKKIQLDIRWATNSQKDITFDNPVLISYLWVEPNRKRDLDNIMSGQKFIQDSLVQMGILKNDGWKQIVSINHNFAVDKDRPGVWVKIREV